MDLHSATWVAPGRYELRPDARRFENWEFNYAAVIGLGVAVVYALAWQMPAIEARVASLAEHLRAMLAGVPGVGVHDLGPPRCGIVSFHCAPLPAEAVKQALARRKIHVSVTTTSSTRLDMERRQLDELVRASVHYYNTEDELERFVAALAEILAA